ncbi:MAG: hypothetical protein ACT4PT_04180 [Methanobacteriota archaeon]
MVARVFGVVLFTLLVLPVPVSAGPVEPCPYPEFGVVVLGSFRVCCERYASGATQCHTESWNDEGLLEFVGKAADEGEDEADRTAAKAQTHAASLRSTAAATAASGLEAGAARAAEAGEEAAATRRTVDVRPPPVSPPEIPSGFAPPPLAGFGLPEIPPSPVDGLLSGPRPAAAVRGLAEKEAATGSFVAAGPAGVVTVEGSRTRAGQAGPPTGPARFFTNALPGFQAMAPRPGEMLAGWVRDHPAAALLLVVTSLALLAPALALYHRIGGHRLLASERRRAMLEYVRHAPGASAVEVAAACGVFYTTARYHLDLLAKFGIIRRRPVGPLVSYFASAAAPSPDLEAHVALARRGANAALLRLVASRPGVDRAEVPGALGLARSTVSERIHLLRRLGLIEIRGRALVLTAAAEKSILDTSFTK